MEIAANNLKRQYELHASEYEKKAVEVLRSGWYIMGPELADFETEFAAYIGSCYCVGLASGLDALWIAFKALGIGAGDEVIVCANAYIACVMGITINGATPVFVEPDEYDNIDARRIEGRITDHTKAILAVHLYGQSCNMSEILATAARHHLKVIEDCAQSHGTKWNGKVCGTFGDIGCFSFYPTKGLGAFGDAGAIVTDHKEYADFIHTFRNYGSEKHYYNEMVGANSRLDELQAGLLRIKLGYLNELNEERCRIAAQYLNEIRNPLIDPLRTRPGSTNTWHQFIIHCRYRDELMAYLKSRGVGTLIHYPIPPHLSDAYAYLGFHKGDFPIAERYAGEVLSLPMYNGMTEAEQQYTIQCINDFKPMKNDQD